jgi:hypothetical protein
MHCIRYNQSVRSGEPPHLIRIEFMSVSTSAYSNVVQWAMLHGHINWHCVTPAHSVGAWRCHDVFGTKRKQDRDRKQKINGADIQVRSQRAPHCCQEDAALHQCCIQCEEHTCKCETSTTSCSSCENCAGIPQEECGYDGRRNRQGRARLRVQVQCYSICQPA